LKAVYLPDINRLNKKERNMKKDITYFGEIEINSPQETTGGMVTIDNHQIRLDLNFYDGVPEHDWVAEYESYIKNLKQHKTKVEAAIRSDYEDGGDVKEYVDFHLEELDASIIDKVLVGTDASKSKEERLLTALKLKRIGFYPGNENYAVWDYTIGREIADMVVVINTDKTGKINYVTWES
jgi:hypothetical protein